MSKEPVFIEYCNLPMKTAFQNDQLETQVRLLVNGSGSDFTKIRNSNSTFRQMVCLYQNGGLSSDVCEKVLELMEEQDKMHPYLMTDMYPFLGEESWILYMKDISYVKVDLCYEDKRYFDIEKIVMQQEPLTGDMELRFYPFGIVAEQEIRLEELDGELYLHVELSDKNKLLNMMKCILLNGTLDLSKFK